MSQTKVQLVSNISGNVSGGASFTGIVTAAGGFSGSLTGTASTATAAGTAYGLTGSPNLTVGNIIGVGATFSGNVSIAGTVYYEDVTNVDSVGLITARSGIVISGGGGINITGGSGIITATSYRGDGSQLTGVSAGLSLRQAGSVIAGGAATTVNFASGATITSVSAGIATVGFSTYFLFPSGSPPVLPTTSGAISLLSFTVHRVGTAGTQLLAGASLNFS